MLKHLPQSAKDVPDWWAARLNDSACDSCLRANADCIGSTHHSPTVSKPGELVSWDTYKVSVPDRFGARTIVLNFHDHYSRVNKPYLIKSESETPLLIGKYIGWQASKGNKVCRLHTDNALAFVSKQTAVYLSLG